MKNILFFAFSLLLSVSVNAQSAKKLLKTASKDFARFNQDQVGNKDKLASAIDAINQAFEIEGTENDPKAWVTKGEIYNGIADAEMKSKLINPESTIDNPDAALVAAEALSMALDKPEGSKAIKRSVVPALKETEAHLSNMAITHFQNGKYADAYKNFKAANEVYEMLKANKADSRLDDEVAMKDQKFYTAISGYYGEMGQEVLPLFKELYEMGTDQPSVYEALYSLNKEANPDEALEYLQAGRKAFPEETSLLFSEINHYLVKGELDKLIDNLKAAMAAEPDNVSVINTTGNVYEQLAAKSVEAGDQAKADEYLSFAEDYYNQSLSKDPENFDANYSIGALYYNRAAAMTDEINKLAQDYSNEGTKKYNEATAKMNKIFEQGLPYFEKAIMVNPDDTNTLIALKEIYVRQGKMEKANEIKAKLGQ